MMNQEEVTLIAGVSPDHPFLTEVIMGLSRPQKSLPAKFLYDKKGSEIFERICRLKEYYPTRAEIEILRTYKNEIAELVGSDVLLIEPGSGAGEKVRYILNSLDHPVGYVPIEISREILLRMTDEFAEDFPDLPVLPVCADFTQRVTLPFDLHSLETKKVVFFPGSTIGNFSPDEAIGLLKEFGHMMDKGGGLLIGVDQKKKTDVLERAYDDSEGVTAEFNLNLLNRLNREADAQFDVDNFEHKAIYNEKLGRIEMHLMSKVPQFVKVHGTVFRFHEGETIHTENSYKYSIEEFCELGAKAGFKIIKHWQDKGNLFCVYYFEKVR